MSRVAPATAPAIANVATARMSGAPVVGSAGRVEELSGGSALAFDAPSLGFQSSPDNDLGRHPGLGHEQGFGRGGGSQPGKKLFSTPTETFASIVESEISVAGDGSGGREGPRAKAFAGLVAKAIATYELNAQVIHGTLPRRGTSLSMTL